MHRNLCSEQFLFSLALAALLGHGAGWLPQELSLIFFIAAVLRFLLAARHRPEAILLPPGALPLLLLSLLPLAQLIPLPPSILNALFPGTGRLYDESLWLAMPAAWMPVSLYPKVTLQTFITGSLWLTVYLLAANLFRERSRRESIIANLMTAAALVALVAHLLELFSPVGAGFGGDGQHSGAAPAIVSLQEQLVMLLPLGIVFLGYRLSLLRHLSLREKVTEIFSRESTPAGVQAALLSVFILCSYSVLMFAPGFVVVTAAVLLSGGVCLLRRRRRRALARLMLAVAGCLILAAALSIPDRGGDGPHQLPALVQIRLLPQTETVIVALSHFPLQGVGSGVVSAPDDRLQAIPAEAILPEFSGGLSAYVAGSGLIGGALILCFLVAWSRWVRQCRQEPESRLASCLLIGSRTSLLAAVMLVLVGASSGTSCVWLVILLGIVVGVSTSSIAYSREDACAASRASRWHNCIAVFALLLVVGGMAAALGIRVGTFWLPDYAMTAATAQSHSLSLEQAVQRAGIASLCDPLEGGYHFARGELHAADGNPRAARQHYFAALRRDPLNGYYLQTLGELLGRNGEGSLGERLIRAGLKNGRSATSRVQFYARWLWMASREEEALSVMREGLTRSPDKTRAFLHMLTLEGASLAELRRALPNRSRCFLDYGDYQKDSGDLPGARDSYQLALGLALAERDAERAIFERLYRHFSTEGNDEAALATLQAGLRLHPTDAELRCLAAETFARLGLYLRATEEYRKALLTDPGNQKASLGLQRLASE